MPISDYTPTLAEVGAVTLGRTVDNVGNQTGTFSATTKPNDTSATLLIGRAASDVSLKIGTDIPASLFDDAKQAVAFRTALLIELTMFGSEVAMDRSPYKQYREIYKESIESLESAVKVLESGGDPRDQTDGRFASYDFGLDSTWMTRRM